MGKPKKIILYLLMLLLFFIALDEMANNAILHLISSKNSAMSFFLVSFFLILQIIAAPIQAGFSDFYCRKKSLIFSTSVSAFSILLTYIFLLNFSFSYLLFFIALLLKAILGNILPIARAGLVDTQLNNFRFSIGLSSSAIAIGYLVLGQLHHIYDLPTSLAFVLFLLLLASILCFKFFKDKEDKHPHKEKHGFKFLIKSEIKSIHKDFLKSFEFQRGLLTYFFWEYSFYLVFLPDIDLSLGNFKHISAMMILGYFIGVILLRLTAKSDQKMLKYGSFIAVSFSVLAILLNLIFGYERINMLLCFSFYSIGYGFMVPCLFSMISKKRKTHEQGKIYGLIDSTDTVAFMLALITVLFYNYYQISVYYILLLSLFNLLLGSVFYADFRREVGKQS